MKTKIFIFSTLLLIIASFSSMNAQRSDYPSIEKVNTVNITGVGPDVSFAGINIYCQGPYSLSIYAINNNTYSCRVIWQYQWVAIDSDGNESGDRTWSGQNVFEISAQSKRQIMSLSSGKITDLNIYQVKDSSGIQN